MWFFLSLLTAILVGCSDTLVKKTLETTRVQTLAWVRPGWAVFFLLPFLPWAGRPTSPAAFWGPVLCAVPFEVAASLLFHKALQTSPLSTSIPYLAFTPVFVLLTGRIFLGEALSSQGIAGILCVTIGAFVLQSPMVLSGEKHISKIFSHEKGPLMVLLVAFIYSFTSILAKKALVASSPLYFCAVYYAVVALGLLPFQMGSASWAKEIFNRPKIFALIGLLEASALFLQFTAFETAPVAYVIAIKRLSLLLSVFFGWLLFKERHFLSRILGAGLMAAGAILIGLA